MIASNSKSRPLKLAVTYRVCWHWRRPVFRRLTDWPGLQLRVFHGADFPGTKVVNTRDFGGIDHVQMWTIRLQPTLGGQSSAFPICPALPFRLLQWRPDVILAEGGSNMLNNLFVFAFALLTRTPVVWWTLGELRGDPPRSRAQRTFRAMVRWMERRSSALLGYSSLALDYFRRCGYPREKQFRAVNCVDTEKVDQDILAARSEVEPLRSRLGLSGKRVLLYVGAIARTKRLEDLIDVYARLKKHDPHLALLIVGDGSHAEALKEHARASRADDIIFTGQVVEGVSTYFLLGDVFVLPGLGGLAISQAMAHGLPVVCTEADGCEIDLVEEGRNGYRLAVGDQQRMEEVLSSLLTDSARLDAMKQHSRWIIDHGHNIHTYMENVVAAVLYAHHGQRIVPAANAVESP